MPVIEGEIEEEIQAVLDPLGIYDGPFTADKYNNVKKNLTEGKSPGPDGISPEVLKRCDLTDIALSWNRSFFLTC